MFYYIDLYNCFICFIAILSFGNVIIIAKLSKLINTILFNIPLVELLASNRKIFNKCDNIFLQNDLGLLLG